MGMGLGTAGQKQNFYNFSRASEQLFYVHFEKLNNFRCFVIIKKINKLGLQISLYLFLFFVIWSWRFSILTLIGRKALATQLSIDEGGGACRQRSSNDPGWHGSSDEVVLYELRWDPSCR
ncbi:unnamed protein product [Camellia sinensis]